MKRTTRRSFLASSAAVAATSIVTHPARGAARVRQDGMMDVAPRSAADTAPFLAAVQRGDLPMVRRLIARTPALASAKDAQGRSAIVLAFLAGHAAIADALIATGVELDLVEASMADDTERMGALLDADPAAVDAPHPVGGTALYAGARAGRTGLWWLQSRGANPEARPFGVTPAYAAFECERWNDAVRVSCALLGNGADVNAPQRDGDSILHAAARRGDAYLVRFVLRKGGDVGARNVAGETPLALARRLGNDSVAELLAHHEDVERDDQSARLVFDANGAPVVWPDMSGLTAVRQGEVTGAAHNDLEAVRRMVQAEPRFVFSFSSQQELPIEAASHTGARDVARFLVDHGSPLSVTAAISLGELERAGVMLEERATRIHERGAHDFAAMWYPSIGGGSVEAAELLLHFGADVNQESQGTTALHWAASRGQLDLIRFLVEQGAELDAVGFNWQREGQTPRELAQARGQDAAAKLLKELGAA